MRWLLAVLLLALGLAAPAIAQTNVVWGLTSGNNVCVYDQSPSRVCVTLGLLNSTSHTLTLTGPGNFSSLLVSGAPVATTSGTLVNGSCVSVNSLGQFVTTDGPCTTGGGGGTVTPALAGQLAYYVSAGTAVSGATTGTGVLTALSVNTGTAGSIVVNGGALGTPSSGVAANLTGLPISTGVSGLGTGVATALGGTLNTIGGLATYSAFGAVRTVASGASDTLLASDYEVGWGSATTSAKAETLPACSSSVSGKTYVISDTAQTAGLYNIVLTPSSGTIGGQASQSVQFSGASMTVQCDGVSNWILE
jgi:hypothetical protein